MMKKTILITGGGSGLGQAIAWFFAEQNFKVYIIGRNPEKLIDTQNKFPECIKTLVADITQFETHNQIFSFIEEETIDYLIHNAGILEPIQPLMKITPNDLNQVLTTNLFAPIFLTQNLLLKLKNARILHISSGLAHEPAHSIGAYCISKAALYMAKEVLNTELKNENIFIGSVMPGIVDTYMQTCLSTMESPKKTFFKTLREKNQLLLPTTVAPFIGYILQKTSNAEFTAGEWDIYETKHHKYWLKEKAIPIPF